MSKTTAPLLSFAASGQIAKTQVYSSWKGRPYVRRYTIPSNPNTSEQQETRSVFSWLQSVWKFAPAGVTDAFDTYASGQVMTGRNAFVKFNLPLLRPATDIEDFVFSPGARSGLPAASVAATAGNDEITVDIVAPALPTGWTIAKGWAAALKAQDPHSGVLYQMASGSDATSTYQVVLTSLDPVEYVVGGWFEYTRPDGLVAYGRSLNDTATPT